jgi:hypothetical protein
MFLTPASVFAAERGHNGGRSGVVAQHFDRGAGIARGNVRGDVHHDFDRGRPGFFGGVGVVVDPAPEYVPVPNYGYYSTPAPYAYQNVPVPAPDCNTAPYGY